MMCSKFIVNEDSPNADSPNLDWPNVESPNAHLLNADSLNADSPNADSPNVNMPNKEQKMTIIPHVYLTMNEQWYSISILHYYSYSLFRRIGSILYLFRIQNMERKKSVFNTH